MKTFLATVAIALMFIGIFLASGFVLMLLTNVVLEYYDAKPLTYPIALAVNGILWLFGGIARGSKSD